MIENVNSHSWRNVFVVLTARESEEDVFLSPHYTWSRVTNARPRAPYCAFMRLLPGVTSHVDHQHVLGLEGLLLTRTFLPATHELLLLAVDVVVVDVLCRELEPLTTAP